jgi:hypothetical protein
LEDPALELERETAAEDPAGEKAPKLWRLFDAIHFLLTPFGLGVPQIGTLLPPAHGKPAEARQWRAIA